MNRALLSSYPHLAKQSQWAIVLLDLSHVELEGKKDTMKFESNRMDESHSPEKDCGASRKTKGYELTLQTWSKEAVMWARAEAGSAQLRAIVVTRTRR